MLCECLSCNSESPELGRILQSTRKFRGDVDGLFVHDQCHAWLTVQFYVCYFHNLTLSDATCAKWEFEPELAIPGRRQARRYTRLHSHKHRRPNRQQFRG